MEPVDMSMGLELAFDAILDVLAKHFDATLKDMYEVGDDGICDDGIWLPGVEGRISLEIQPDLKTLSRLRRPHLFVGPFSAEEATDTFFIEGEAYRFTSTMSFVAAVFFPVPLGKSATDRVTDKSLGEREHQLRRAMRYQGALKRCLHTYIEASEVIEVMVPVDQRVTAAISLQEPASKIGSALYYFQIDQEQVAPKPIL